MKQGISSESSNLYEQIIHWITSVISCIIPFLARVPNLTLYTGAMLIPLFSYMYFIFIGLSSGVMPLPDLTSTYLQITISVVVTLEFLVWSIVVLHKDKSSGLVTSGPYKYVRHPQYLAFIILTGIITYNGILVANNTLFGQLFIRAEYFEFQWLLMILSYVFLMFIEEKSLEKQYGSEWTEYRDRVSHMFPFIRFRIHSFLENLLVFVIPYSILKVILLYTV